MRLLLLLAGCGSPTASDPASSAGPPDSTFTPGVVDFGPVSVGTSASIEVRIANEGTVDLVGEVFVRPADLGVAVDAEAVELEPGIGQRVNVTFTPGAIGELEAELVLRVGGEERIAGVTGEGLGPQLSLSPDPLALGEVVVGCPIVGSVPVRNDGDLPVTIDAFTLANPVFVATGGAGSVGPDRRAWVDVTATPLVVGESLGTLLAETALGSVYVGEVSVLGLESTLITDTFVVPRSDADILVVLDAALASQLDVPAEIVDMLPLTEGSHRFAVTVADDGCVPGPWIDNTTADPLSALDDMLQVPGGFFKEEGFDRTLAALSPEALGAGGCNEALLRDDAALYVLAIADSSDESSLSWSDFLAELAAMKGDSDAVIVNAIAGDWPVGCEYADAAGGWYEATVATGGVYLEICATDWASHVRSDVADRFPGESSFELSEWPADGEVRVYVDGEEVLSGWSYDVVDHAVQFEDPLSAETEITVVYEVGC